MSGDSDITHGQFAASLGGLTNDAVHNAAGWTHLDAEGEAYYVINATGSATFDTTYFAYGAVQLR